MVTPIPENHGIAQIDRVEITRDRELQEIYVEAFTDDFAEGWTLVASTTHESLGSALGRAADALIGDALP